MSKYLKIIITVFALMAIFFGCNRNNQPETKKNLDEIEKEYKKPMMEWNEKKVRDQDMRIKKYVERRDWDMTRTGTGLFYEIYEEGTGSKTDTGKYVTIKYKVELLDGTFCYSSDSSGLRNLKPGKMQIERGLEETLLKMREGDKARIIAPPHLAYGLPGDGEKIPADATLVYHVELINAEENE